MGDADTVALLNADAPIVHVSEESPALRNVRVHEHTATHFDCIRLARLSDDGSPPKAGSAE
jgi:hypothetical protein